MADSRAPGDAAADAAPKALDLTRRGYDRLAPIYDLVAGPFEWPLVRKGLTALQAQPGEQLLEVGHGTGRALVELAGAVGPEGHVVGLDLSPRMAEVAHRRLQAAGQSERVRLVTGDATAVALGDAPFDAVFSAFTLETFERRAALALLSRLRSALRPAGRVVLVSMARGDAGLMSGLYGWSHRRFPALVDCAPIDAAQLLAEAGFTAVQTSPHRLFGIAAAVTRAGVPD